MKQKTSGRRAAPAAALVLTLAIAGSVCALRGQSATPKHVPPSVTRTFSVNSENATGEAEAETRDGWQFLPCGESLAYDNTVSHGTVRGGRNGECCTAYNEDDLYWLSRIIHAEAGSEPFRGKLAVGCVVMNRVASPAYPDTVREVIFDTRHGVQFTPAVTGTVHQTPDPESVIAARACLGGYSISESILFFQNEAIATSSWTRDNRPYVMTIGRHNFYS